MGILYVDTLEPQSGTTLTVGESGQNTVVGGNTVKLNSLKDAGGNQLLVSDGSGNLSSVNSGFGGAMTLITSTTATDQASISFTSGITSTYSEIRFKLYNIDMANTGNITWQVSTDGGSTYATPVTSTYFVATNNPGVQNILTYDSNGDQSNGTSFQPLGIGQANGANESWMGILHLFNPTSAVYYKMFMARGHRADSYYQDQWTAGYWKTTSAINAIQFKAGSGNLSGTIKMFGIK